MDRSVVGIDIGTQRILVLVGEIGEGGDVRIVGVGQVPAKGIKKGVVVNVAQATVAISEAVEQAEQSSGYQIERGFVGITGAHVTSRNSTGVVGVTRRDRGIAPDDVDRALEAAGAIVLPQNQELVHILPRTYTVDGQEGVRNPLGMHGFRLEVEAHVVMGASTALQNLRAPLFEEKVVDHLLGQVSVTDVKVSKEELLADDEDDAAPAKAAKKSEPKKKAAPKKKAKDAEAE